MDKYGVREEFLQARDRFFKSTIFAEFNYNADRIAYDPDLNQLERYTTNEKIIYLTTKGFLFGFTYLGQMTAKCMNVVAKIINDYNLDIDKLDPLTVGNYLHFKSLQLLGGWCALYEIEDALEAMEQALIYFEKSKFYDREIFATFFLGGVYFSYALYEKAEQKFLKALRLIESADDITHERKQNLEIRIKSQLVLTQSKFQPPENLTEFADEILNMIIQAPNHIHRYNTEFVDIIVYFLSVNQIDKARKIARRAYEIYEEQNGELIINGFLGFTYFENIPMDIYLLRNIINLNDPNIETKIKGYQNLDKALDSKHISENEKLKVLQFQVEYLLKIYRGFQEDASYLLFLDKVMQIIDSSIKYKDINSLISGVLLYSRLIILKDGKHQAYEFLKDQKAKFMELGIGHLNGILEDEINDIAQIQLTGTNIDKLEQLQIENYIRKAVKMVNTDK